MADLDDLRRIVTVGASAGGVEALTRMAAELPADLPFAVLVVLHMPAAAPSVLARILDRAGPLPAETAVGGTALEAQRIYVCAPDRHLMVEDHRAVLSQGPTENGHRPAINALFRSAALAYGPRAVGVLLSGVLDDGVLGLQAIQSRGGTTIVQTPDDAIFPAMPANALAVGAADYQVKATEIGSLLTQLAAQEHEERVAASDRNLELENQIAMARPFSTNVDIVALGPPSGFTCPDCNGSLATVGETNYRCHVGHAWSAEALLRARDDEVEGALWVAVRSLQEKVRLAERMAATAGSEVLFDRYREQVTTAERALTILSSRKTAASPSTTGQ